MTLRDFLRDQRKADPICYWLGVACTGICAGMAVATAYVLIGQVQP